MMDDVFVYYLEMPVNEAVCPCGPFSYNIYINPRLSRNGQIEAYKHAMRHIQNGDFERTDVQSVEVVAHANRA